MATTDALVYRPDFGTIENGAPFSIIADKGVEPAHMQIAICSFTPFETQTFYTKKAAEFWLTLKASHELYINPPNRG